MVSTSVRDYLYRKKTQRKWERVGQKERREEDSRRKRSYLFSECILVGGVRNEGPLISSPYRRWVCKDCKTFTRNVRGGSKI